VGGKANFRDTENDYVTNQCDVATILGFRRDSERMKFCRAEGDKITRLRLCEMFRFNLNAKYSNIKNQNYVLAT
jgi:hypothetical protein